MAYASQSGRARTSTTNPEAHAICDRCSFRYNFNDLSWQYEWRGSTLQNVRILVCMRCLDVPQEQLRAITLPADPVPIINARVEIYSLDSLDYIGTGSPTISPSTGIPIPSQNVLGGATVNDIIIPQPLGPNSRPNARGHLIPSVLGLDPNSMLLRGPLTGVLQRKIKMLYYIASSGQTLFLLSVPDMFGNTLTLNGALQVSVSKGGLRLAPYNGTTGDFIVNLTNNTITLLFPAGAGDILAVDAFLLAF